MKSLLKICLILICLYSCKKEEFKSKDVVFRYMKNGIISSFENSYIEKDFYFNTYYASMPLYKVNANQIASKNTMGEEFAILYFVDSKDSVFLHSIQITSSKNPKIFYLRDVKDANFYDEIKVKTSKINNKIVCKFNIKYRGVNPALDIIDGACEFDITSKNIRDYSK